jgi:hypothetical protein
LKKLKFLEVMKANSAQLPEAMPEKTCDSRPVGETDSEYVLPKACNQPHSPQIASRIATSGIQTSNMNGWEDQQQAWDGER